MKKIRLSSGDLFAQLKRHNLELAGVIYCRIIGNSPVADWFDTERTRSRLELGKCADLALEHLERDPDASLIILCDPYLEGREQPEGAEWDTAARTSGLFVGILSYILMLICNATLKKLLHGHPERLMFAIFDEGRIVFATDEAKRLVGMMQNIMSGG